LGGALRAAGFANPDEPEEAPPADEAEMDQFVSDHAKWMNETHAPNRTGREPSPLYFAWSKGEQLNNPWDASRGTTGKTHYSLVEVYKSPYGVEAHMAAGQANEKLFSTGQKMLNKYGVQTNMGAPIVRSM